MKTKFLLSSTLALCSVAAMAQSSNKAYAITGDGNNDFLWMNIRQIDLKTGTVQKTLFDRKSATYSLTNVETKATTSAAAITDGNVYMNAAFPTGTFVAAAAYDNRSGKLFFMPMRHNELRWVDVNSNDATPHFYSLPSDALVKTNDNTDEAKHMTRMVIGANGKGYAISNDGNNVIEFTTGKKITITTLGGLADSELNKGVSIHNKCSSWGGDMVADAFGKLLIVSAMHQVFEVDINSRIATHKGTISGLPANYTSNGVAVDADGGLVVCSANVFEGYYRIKMEDLSATKIEGSDVKYNASDLAGSNLLYQKQADAAKKFDLAKGILASNSQLNFSNKIFPNPVTGSSFTIKLDGAKDGEYYVLIADLTGRAMQNSKVAVLKGQQIVKINVAGRPAKGSYLVTVLDGNKQNVFSDKLLIQ